MSWHFLQESVVVFLEDNSLDGTPFAPSKLTNTTVEFCLNASEMDASTDSPYGTMYVHSTVNLGEEKSESSLAASRAKIFPSPVNEKESAEKNLDSGKSTGGSLRKSNQGMSSQKTPVGLSPQAWKLCFKTLPRWGLMRHGQLYPLPQSEHHTSVNEHTSWPTPVSRGQKGTGGAVGLKGGSAAFKKLVNLVGRTEALGMSCGRLNPVWTEFYLMGWPMHWTDITRSATDSYREWLDWRGISCNQQR